MAIRWLTYALQKSYFVAKDGVTAINLARTKGLTPRQGHKQMR